MNTPANQQPGRRQSKPKEKKPNIVSNLIWQYFSIPFVPFLFFLLLGIFINVFIPIEPFPLFVRISCSIILAGIGLLIYFLAMRVIKRQDITFLQSDIQPNIISIEGPFKYTRNPIFLSFTIFFVSFFLFINNAWGFVMVPFLIMTLNKYVFWGREYHMLEQYGEEYEDYMQKAARWL